MNIIGIDLGTTNSCLAILEHGSASVLANAEGARTTPSVVSFPDDDEKLVGVTARRQGAIHPEQTVTSVKRLMGRRVKEIKNEIANVPYQVVPGKNDSARIVVSGKEYTPEQISAFVLEKLKADAESYLREEVTEAVITVPAYFNDAQRKATKQAAEIAGLKVLRLVNEPTAAALAYGFQNKEEETLLVFDLGGGTFDVSVLEIGDNVFDVLATHGDNHLGGDDFDTAIVNWLVEKFKAENDIDLRDDAAAMQRLYVDAEAAKIQLSTTPTATINLPFISSKDNVPLHLEVTVSRSEINELCADLIERLVEPTLAAIAEAEKKSGPIDHVILVGGMTRMKAVQEKVEELTGKKAHQGVNPDEAVAVGAAIQAGVLLGEVKDVLLLDVIPLSLGIETLGGLMTKLIDSNTTIPVKFVEIFSTAEDNQPSVEIHILQGEREMASDNRSLGRLQLLGVPPAQAGVPQIEVTFEVNADGVLSVSGKDLGTGNHQEIEIKAASGLSDDEVEEMRQEALINRQQDAETRANAEEMVACEVARDAARKQLVDNNALMNGEENEQISTLAAELENKLNEGAHREELKEIRLELLGWLQSFSRRVYSDERVGEINQQQMNSTLINTIHDEWDEDDLEIIEEDS